MAKWSCKTAAHICAVPAPRTSCNGPPNNGKNSGLGARRARLADFATVFPNTVSKRIRYQSYGFSVIQCSHGAPKLGHLPVTILMELRPWGINVSSCFFGGY